jgi:hypothetical protein
VSRAWQRDRIGALVATVVLPAGAGHMRETDQGATTTGDPPLPLPPADREPRGPTRRTASRISPLPPREPTSPPASPECVHTTGHRLDPMPLTEPAESRPRLRLQTVVSTPDLSHRCSAPRSTQGLPSPAAPLSGPAGNRWKDKRDELG